MGQESMQRLRQGKALVWDGSDGEPVEDCGQLCGSEPFGFGTSYGGSGRTMLAAGAAV